MNTDQKSNLVKELYPCLSALIRGEKTLFGPT